MCRYSLIVRQHWHPIFIKGIFQSHWKVFSQSSFPPENSHEHLNMHCAHQFGECDSSVKLTINLIVFLFSLAASQTRNLFLLTHSNGISPFLQLYVMLPYGGMGVGHLPWHTFTLDMR